MGGVKVAMAISYPAIYHSLLKEGGIFTGKAISIILDVLIPFLRNGVADVFFGLGEVLLSICGNSIKVTKGTDISIGLCLLMKLYQSLCQATYDL